MPQTLPLPTNDGAFTASGLPEPPPAVGPPPSTPMPAALANLPQPEPSSYETQERERKEQELAQERTALENSSKILAAALDPDTLKRMLPKPTATQMLSDWMYNFSQLNLRNQTFGSLAGQAFVPIEQQRLLNAQDQLKQRVQAAQVENTARRDAMNAKLGEWREARLTEQTGIQKRQNDARLEQAERRIAQTDRKLTADQELDKAKLALSKNVTGADIRLKEARMKQMEAYGGRANFESEWVNQHRSDPDFEKQWIAIKKELNEATARPITPWQQISTLRLQALQQVPQNLGTYISRTVRGNQYINASNITDAIERAMVAQQGRGLGLHVITDKAIEEKLLELDGARVNAQKMFKYIEDLLPRDAAGRIVQYPAIKLDQLLQTDARRAAWDASWISAINRLKAAGPAHGFRMTEAEIEATRTLDSIQRTDTVATAIERLRIVEELLDSAEDVTLSHDRKPLQIEGSPIKPTPPRQQQRHTPSPVAPPATKPHSKGLPAIFQ